MTEAVEKSPMPIEYSEIISSVFDQGVSAHCSLCNTSLNVINFWGLCLEVMQCPGCKKPLKWGKTVYPLQGGTDGY